MLIWISGSHINACPILHVCKSRCKQFSRQHVCISDCCVNWGYSFLRLKACLCADDNWLSELQLFWKMLCRIFFFTEATCWGEYRLNSVGKVSRGAAYAAYSRSSQKHNLFLVTAQLVAASFPHNAQFLFPPCFFFFLLYSSHVHMNLNFQTYWSVYLAYFCEFITNLSSIF